MLSPTGRCVERCAGLSKEVVDLYVYTTKDKIVVAVLVLGVCCRIQVKVPGIVSLVLLLEVHFIYERRQIADKAVRMVQHWGKEAACGLLFTHVYCTLLPVPAVWFANLYPSDQTHPQT